MNTHYRDLALFGLLITLLKVFVFTHAKEKTSNINNKNCVSHKADFQDKKILQQIANLQKELNILLNKTHPKHSTLITQIQSLLYELNDIKKKYTHISPSTLFLGPFGAIGTVSKQRKMERNVREITKTVHDLKQTI